MPPTSLPKYTERSAVVSDCGRYRYVLSRSWGGGDTLVWCMLNPSRADGTIDDRTLARCVGYARAWNYGGLVLVNLFALRSTDPAALVSAADPVGPDNDRHLVEQASGRRVVCAWGATVTGSRRPTLRDRPGEVLRLLRPVAAELCCLGLTSGGEPLHPLRLKADLRPVPFAGRDRA